MRIKRDEAAGGVVARPEDDAFAVVLIATERYGTLRWSLPKGHFKGSESSAQAALREVTEETGLTTEIVTALPTIDYWFVEKHVRYHKFVHYFLMRPIGGRFDLHDDEVVDVRWFPIGEALRHMAYPNERAMLEAEAPRILELLR